LAQMEALAQVRFARSIAATVAPPAHQLPLVQRVAQLGALA